MPRAQRRKSKMTPSGKRRTYKRENWTGDRHRKRPVKGHKPRRLRFEAELGEAGFDDADH
jgi:hypothetical protein